MLIAAFRRRACSIGAQIAPAGLGTLASGPGLLASMGGRHGRSRRSTRGVRGAERPKVRAGTGAEKKNRPLGLGWACCARRKEEGEREGARMASALSYERRGGKEKRKTFSFSDFCKLAQIGTRFEFKAAQL